MIKSSEEERATSSQYVYGEQSGAIECLLKAKKAATALSKEALPDREEAGHFLKTLEGILTDLSERRHAIASRLKKKSRQL